MNSVCNLFEGGYHFGLAALVHSRYRAGFRGALLPWVLAASAAPLMASVIGRVVSKA